MKKAMMVVGIISLSLLLSDLSFAKKKKKRKDGVVATTVKGGVGVVNATGKAAVGITQGAVNTTGNILQSF